MAELMWGVNFIRILLVPIRICRATKARQCYLEYQKTASCYWWFCFKDSISKFLQGITWSRVHSLVILPWMTLMGWVTNLLVPGNNIQHHLLWTILGQKMGQIHLLLILSYLIQTRIQLKMRMALPAKRIKFTKL